MNFTRILDKLLAYKSDAFNQRPHPVSEKLYWSKFRESLVITPIFVCKVLHWANQIIGIIIATFNPHTTVVSKVCQTSVEKYISVHSFEKFCRLFHIERRICHQEVEVLRIYTKVYKTFINTFYYEFLIFTNISWNIFTF